MQKPIIVAIVMSVLFAPAVVHAADSRKAREKAAKKACASGDYRRGVDILSELYVDTDNVTFIYNQGRCYEQNHQWVSAIDRFREYLRKSTNAPSTERAEAEAHLAECESFRAQEEARLAPVTPVAPPPPPITPITRPEPPPPPPPHPIAVTERPAAPDPARGSGLRVAGIVLGSVGVAAAATGLVLNLKANGLAKDYNQSQNAAKPSSHSSYKTGAIIGYGVGAGALVTGIILYMVGHRAGQEAPSHVSLFSSFTSTEMSLGVRGGF